MDELFEIFNRNDLVRNDKIVNEKINRMSVSQILDVSEEIKIITSMKDFKPDNRIVSHSASVSLAGGRYPCSGIDCRSKHVEQLAQFSAFYSDRVYISNFFSDYSSHTFEKANEENIKRNFANDVFLFQYLRPLIINGNIVPVTPPNSCVHCLVENYLGTGDGEKRFFTAQKELIERYNKDLEYFAVINERGFVLTTQGPKHLLEHPTKVVFYQVPDVVKSSPALLSRLKSGNDVRLSRDIIREIGSDEDFAKKVFENITFDMSTSQYLGTSFLTERQIDIETLQKISGSPDIVRRNQIIQKHLKCLVPIIENITPSELLEIRRKEEDSFFVFRGALNKTIDEYIKNKENFEEQDAKTIYSDIIHPQLSKLNIAIRDTKINSIKKASAKFVSWGGAITVGLYAGFLPSELVAAATALGLVPLIAELANDLISLNGSEKEARKEDFYFLWKANQ